MDPITGLAIGGVASTLLGGLFGSSSASKAAAAEQAAAREARQLKVDKDAESQFFADVAMYGKNAAIQRFQARYGPNAAKYLGESAADPNFNDQQRARVAELDKIIADGWDQTSCLGERTGKKITIGGLVLEKIQGKDGYDKSTLVDRIVATKFDSALKTELQPIVEEAKKKFRASIDNIMQTKLQAVLKESLGLK